MKDEKEDVLNEYTVQIISEIVYTVKVKAKNEDDAEDKARYGYVGPCSIKLEGSEEVYYGNINDVWSGEDVEVVGEE